MDNAMIWVKFGAGLVISAIGLSLLIWFLTKAGKEKRTTLGVVLSFMVFVMGGAVAFHAHIQLKALNMSLEVAPSPDEINSFNDAFDHAATPEQMVNAINQNQSGAVGSLEFLKGRVQLRYALNSMYQRLEPGRQPDTSLSDLAKEVCDSGAIPLSMNYDLVRFAHDTHFIEWPDTAVPDARVIRDWHDKLPHLLRNLDDQEIALLHNQLKLSPSNHCVASVEEIPGTMTH